MKKILLLLSLFISIKSFSQIKPTNPVAVPQMTWYRDINGHMWAFRGSTLGYIQMLDSTQATGGGTVTSITPGIGFVSHTPITTAGTLTIDTAAIRADLVRNFQLGYYAKLSGGNIFSGNQTIHANIMFPDANNGIQFAGSSIANGIQALEFNTGEIDGFKFKIFGDDVFDLASTGHGANIPYAKFSTNLSWKPTGNQQFHAPGTSRFVVQIYDPSAGSDKGLADTISGAAARALLGVYTKTKVDSLLSQITPASITYTSGTGSSNTFTNTALIGQFIDGVWRDGVEYQLTSGTPVGNFANVNTTTGAVTFQDNISSSEYIKVRYRGIAGVSIGGAIQVVNAASYADMNTQLSGTGFKVFYVKADEVNGGGTPAQYLYYNGFLIRNVPQQAN